MKIWILTSETPEYIGGGIARYVDNVARGIARYGHEVRVISRGDRPGEREIVPGYTLQVFREHRERPEPKRPPKRPDEHPHFPYNLLDYWTALSYQYAEEIAATVSRVGAPDLIESQDYVAISYYAQQRQMLESDYLPGVPFVLHLHSPDFILQRANQEPEYLLPQYWHGRMVKANLVAADAIVSPSHYLAEQVSDELAEHDLEVTRIPYPWTDPASDQAEGNTPDPSRVLYLGRLEYRKGVVQLLRACENLWRDGSGFTLEMAGGDTPYTPRGEMMGAFIRRRYRHRIESGQLRLLGQIEQPALFAEICGVGTVVIPSVWENFPNTCIESMMFGKVTVVSKHGGQAEMVGSDERCGFCFDWSVPGEFETRLQGALALSETERAAIGRRARARIEELCHPDRVIPARIAHFESVLAARRPRAFFPFIDRESATGGVNERIPETGGEPGRVSVIVPFYNLANYLGETLESVRASDYADIETIVVDDGSTDTESIALLERYEANPPMRDLRIVHKANAGLAAARNTGAEAATGEFLVFLDADDLVEPAFISRAVTICRRYQNVHVVYSWERYFQDSDDIWPTWNLEFPYLLGKNQAPARALVRRDAYLAFGRNKSRMAYNYEDYDGWVSLVAAGCGGVSIPECLVRYRLRKDSLWQTSNRHQQLFLHELMLEHHGDLYRRYGPELFGLLNANGSAQRWAHPGCLNPVDKEDLWKGEFLARIERDWANMTKCLEDRDRAIRELQEGVEWNQKEWQHYKEVSRKLREEADWRKACMERLEREVAELNEQLSRERDRSEAPRSDP